MSDARASDSNRLVSHIITYIPCDIATSSITTPLMLLNDKSKRGWNHNSTAAVLCPLKLRTTFLRDPLYACFTHRLLRFDQMMYLQSLSQQRAEWDPENQDG